MYATTMRGPYKLLVAGDRAWTSVEGMSIVFQSLPLTSESILIHGGCYGVDIMASFFAEQIGMKIRAYPANWAEHGHAAGPIRNSEMLAKEHRVEEPITLCAIFHDDLHGSSKGSFDMARQAARAGGIPIKVFSSSGELIENFSILKSGPQEIIDQFVGDYAFLSNFHPSTIVYGGRKWPTVEHVYQAAKTLVPEEIDEIHAAQTAAQAKRLGRKVQIRSDWDSVKISVMKDLVTLKFQNPFLRDLLLKTGDSVLIEGNKWNDKFWGVCRGEGQNWLGRILEEVRRVIKIEEGL